MTDATVSAYTGETDTQRAIDALFEQLGSRNAGACFVFASPNHDLAALGAALKNRFPGSNVIGCSTCGEYTDTRRGQGGVAVLHIPEGVVVRHASALARFDAGVDVGIQAATAQIERELGVDMRELDPSRWVGVVLPDGARMLEERINEELGNVAPLLSFVGGSAGDNLALKQTFVQANGEKSDNGAALMLLETARPYRVMKTCNAVVTDRSFVITRADVEKRLVYELDGRPAAEAYAEAIGTTADSLEFTSFLANPLGLMIDGEPWLRSALRREGTALHFACAVLEGTRMNLMTLTNLVDDTRAALDRARVELGRPIAGGLMFNCAYRMIEMQVKGLEAPYHEVLSGFPLAGFHTHGESWLGHINQTLTALLLT